MINSKNEELIVRKGCVSFILFSSGEDLLEQAPEGSNRRSGQGVPTLSYPIKGRGARCDSRAGRSSDLTDKGCSPMAV